VLANYCPPTISIYAVYPSRRYLSAKLRSFVDFLAACFGERPEWDRFPAGVAKPPASPAPP
jgi:DNA-binding transcriptional LysR family regulator